METNYTWKEEYVLPYESLYSVREKFCYLNAVDWPYFIRIRNSLGGIEGLSQLYYYSSLGVRIIPGISLPCYEEIQYCPLCAQYGYHSVFHQVILLKNCYIHKRQPLIRILGRHSIMRTNDFYYGTPGKYLDLSPKIEDMIYPTYLLRKAKKVWGILKTIDSLYFLDPYYHRDMDNWIVNDSTSKLTRMFFEGKQKTVRGITLIIQKGEKELLSNDFKDYYGNSTPDIIRKYIEKKINEEFSDSHEFFQEVFNLEEKKKLCKDNSSKYATILLIYSTIRLYYKPLSVELNDSWFNISSKNINAKNRIIDIMDETEKLKRKSLSEMLCLKMDVFKEAMLKESFGFAKEYLTKYLHRHFDEIISSEKNVFQTDLPIRYPQFYLIKITDFWSLYMCI